MTAMRKIRLGMLLLLFLPVFAIAKTPKKQVAYAIGGDKTRKREIDSLFSVARKTGCQNLLLVTDHERETLSEGGFVVEVVPAREWLLGKIGKKL